MDTPEDKVKKEGTVDTASPLQCQEGKPGKTPVFEPTTGRSVRASSPDSLIGEGFLASVGVPAPENNVPNAPSTRIPARKHLSSPPSAESLSPPISPMASKALKSASSSIPTNSSNQIKPGRPPRAPAGDVNPQTKTIKDSTVQLPTVHTRGISTGENSIMSGLTDPMLDDTEVRQPQRPRGVSFGEEVEELSPGSTRDVPPKDPSSRPRPILTDDPQRSTRLISSPQKALNAINAINRVEKKLAMTDIVNPIESEAEKAILRALEDRERNIAQSTAAAVLPNVPDDVVVSFQDHANELQQQQDSQEETRSRRLSEAKASFTSIRSKPSLDKEQSKSLLQADNQKLKAVVDKFKNQKQGHTPTEGCMETTLFNLANQMRDIQTNEDNLSVGAASNKPSDNVNHPMLNVAVESPRNQSDTLANDAALLFRGQKKVSDPLVLAATSPGTMEMDPKKNDDIIMEGDEAESMKETDLELGLPTNGGSESKDDKPNRLSAKAGSLFRKTLHAAKEDLNYLDHFLVAKKKTAIMYAKSVFVFLILPATSVAAILFYGLGNPLMKTGSDPKTNVFPSVSWFILFLCVRQVITFSMAKVTEMIFIDFLALKTRLLLRMLGPVVTLLVVQAKGWPCTLTFWAIYDLIMLSGDGAFPNHWAFYQDAIGLFNERNPSGGITSDPWNYRILIAGMVIGVVVAIKRLVVGMYLGGKQYSTYGAKLAAVIQKMILISEVARLARQLARENISDFHRKTSREEFNWDFPSYGDALLREDDDDDDDNEETDSALSKSPRASGDVNPYNKSLKSSERMKLLKLLDQWEEPTEERSVGKVSIKGILQFKQTLAFMDLSYPFSRSFGLADTREHCVLSAEDVYKSLLSGNLQFETLQFETLTAVVRVPGAQELDEVRLKELVKVFRPERDGSLDMLGFVRSVDQVYKDLRLLRASIRNSSQIDHAFEAIINVGFYFLIFCVVLASWGIDPLSLFLSLSSVILAFSFAIGSASAKYFEGLMFILGRNPYDIGDRISINSPNELPVADGVSTWYVEEVTLYYTTVRLGATNEVATISNSALANSRIVNAARSKKALVYIKLKFGIDVPYAKIQVFKETVESFVKARPREWLNCSGIRSTRVEADFGYIEYVVVLHHRDSWQQIGSILESKAAVMSFCLEVQKKLGMRYTAPSTPVDLTMKNPQVFASMFQGVEETSHGSPGILFEEARARTQSADLRSIADMFTVASH